MGKQFGAGDDAGNRESRKPHGLRAVEGGILKSGKPRFVWVLPF
jgi:hypothetical protein